VNLEDLGLFGIFIAGITVPLSAVVSAGILVGLNPIEVLFASLLGNTVVVLVFAFAGSRISEFLKARRIKRGKSEKSRGFARAEKYFEKFGIYGAAALAPILLGTQFVAAISITAGVRPRKAIFVITIATIIWSIIFALIALQFEPIIELDEIELNVLELGE
jgi:uncharacterized membrane protein